MLTSQTYIALALVSSLSPEEIQAFANEFAKKHRITAKPKREKKKLVDLPDTEVLAQLLLQKHRSKTHSRASQLA